MPRAMYALRLCDYIHIGTCFLSWLGNYLCALRAARVNSEIELSADIGGVRRGHYTI